MKKKIKVEWVSAEKVLDKMNDDVYYKRKNTRLTDEQKEILEEANKNNKKYINALVEAAKILPQRSSKYSGNEDPYTNFYLMRTLMSEHFKHKYGHELDMNDVFLFYLTLKYARLMVSGSKDFEDDTSLDGIRDLLNYAALNYGFMLGDK